MLKGRVERSFDKIPKLKIIYWAVAISLEGQNNSISGIVNNSIYCLTKNPIITISVDWRVTHCKKELE